MLSKRLTIIFTSLFYSLTADNAKVEFFENKIRPILAQECYECHSIHTHDKGGLLLDSREAWKKGGDSGAVIIPGNAKESLLFKSISHLIDDLKMPKAGAKMTPQVIQDFEQWINEGAFDPRDLPPDKEELVKLQSWEAIAKRRSQWWSFLPLEMSPIPKTTWSTHPIDAYIEKKWKENNITPTKLADSEAILRKIHYILTGLSPTSADIISFKNNAALQQNQSALIKEKITTLLNSPHYGERWARHWMDWFRYSEGHGGQGDFQVPGAYEYRDYLIRAINANLPYDQMIQEHIAGDLLTKPRLHSTENYPESPIATAHLRMVEHGFFPVDSKDEMVKFVDNQIDVVTKATLGLTVSCARCHHHKFDAISQDDYYALFGIFSSSKPSTQPIYENLKNNQEDNINDAYTHLEKIILKTWLEEIDQPQWIEQFKSIVSKLNLIEQKVEKEDKTALDKKVIENPVPKKLLLLYPFELLKSNELFTQKDTLLKEHKKTISLNKDKIDHTLEFSKGLPEGWKNFYNDISFNTYHKIGLSTDGKKLVATILAPGLLSYKTDINKESSVLSNDFIIPDAGYAIEAAGQAEAWMRLVPNNFPIANNKSGIYGQNHLLFNGVQEINHWNANFWKNEKGYIHLMTKNTKTILARSNQENEKKLITESAKNPSWFHISKIHQLKKSDDKLLPFMNENNLVLNLLKNHKTIKNNDLIQLYQRSAKSILIKLTQNLLLSDDEHFFINGILKLNIFSNQIITLPNELKQHSDHYYNLIQNSPQRIFPTVCDNQGSNSSLYTKGNIYSPEKEVPRAFLTSLGGRPYNLSQQESGRLQLANDIISKKNPLFARVMVNRVWHHVFGKPIVQTADNFGHTGTLPSHPELLDHLSLYFIDSGYDVKKLLLYIMTSQVFQLSHEPSVQALNKDPLNQFLSHANVRRLDAEVIRDHLLEISGNINLSLYGKSEKQDDSSNRRSIYTRVDRTKQGPILASFDVPMPTTTRATRDTTTTPSQAITLMNSAFIKLQYETFAKNNSAKPLHDVLKIIYLQAFNREIKKDELKEWNTLYNISYEKNPADTLKEILHIVFNLKEFIYLY
jgi:hypothetical protein